MIVNSAIKKVLKFNNENTETKPWTTMLHKSAKQRPKYRFGFLIIFKQFWCIVLESLLST